MRPYVGRPEAISDRKAGIALNNLLAQQRPLARFPERCRVDDSVAKRTAIGTIAARDRAWNANELGPHFVTGEPHRRIAVTAHIHEFKVRGKVRIGTGVSALQIEARRVFEARADAVLEEHVVAHGRAVRVVAPSVSATIGVTATEILIEIAGATIAGVDKCPDPRVGDAAFGDGWKSDRRRRRDRQSGRAHSSRADRRRINGLLPIQFADNRVRLTSFEQRVQ